MRAAPGRTAVPRASAQNCRRLDMPNPQQSAPGSRRLVKNALNPWRPPVITDFHGVRKDLSAPSHHLLVPAMIPDGPVFNPW